MNILGGGYRQNGKGLGVKLVIGTLKIKNKTRQVLTPRKQKVVQNKKSNHNRVPGLAAAHPCCNSNVTKMSMLRKERGRCTCMVGTAEKEN